LQILKEFLTILKVGTSRKALRLGDTQVAERFYTPQEIADKYNVAHLNDVFVSHPEPEAKRIKA
jgi:hypothetical protein